MAADGGCERDVVHRMKEGYRAWGALKSVLSNRGFRIKAKKCLHEGVILPTSLYGAETSGMRSAEIRKVNVLEMKCLRSLVRVSRMDRVRNEEVRCRAGIERELASREDQSCSEFSCSELTLYEIIKDFFKFCSCCVLGK